jgi:hypothetical protein
MGAIIFIIATIASIYWFNRFYRSLSNNLPPVSSRRRVISIDHSPAAQRQMPVVTPVEQVKVPESQPPARLLPIIPQIAAIDSHSAALPNFSTTPTPTEESLLFRLLVQGLVVISMISTDLAAGTHSSLIGILFTTIGAGWSWHRRRNAKHWLNISVSVTSLAILIGLLVPILFKDLQLAIANYLILVDGVAQPIKLSAYISFWLGMLFAALQMGLSFHLYNRQILGYCFVTSGLLIGVAASLSQNLGFPILLCGLIAIAMPALMLDYRSRIALKPIGITTIATPKQLSYRHLPWQYLSQLAAISIGLGLIVAVFLPTFHLPHLALKPTELDRLHTIAQKEQNPLPEATSSPTSNPSPPATNTPTPELTELELAAKVLGQPENNNYPELIKQHNLQLSPEAIRQFQQFTQKILDTSPKPLKSDFDRVSYIAEYLKLHHKADPQQSDSTNLPPLDAKSYQKLIAQCTATPKDCQLVGDIKDLQIFYTSLLRSIGIPARLKTGDKIDEIDPQTKMYPRSTEPAQSQTEVYFANWGWLKLDPTPDRPLLKLDSQQLAQFQQSLPPAAQPTPTPQSSPTSSSPIPLKSPPPKPPAAQANGKATPEIWRILVMAIAICGGIIWYLWYQNQQQQQLAKLPPIEQIYRSMVTNLSNQGLVKHPAQTQLEYADSASKIYHPQIAKVVWEISQLYTAWRYGKQRIDVKQLAKKLQYLQHLQQLADKKRRKQWFDRQKSR